MREAREGERRREEWSEGAGLFWVARQTSAASAACSGCLFLAPHADACVHLLVQAIAPTAIAGAVANYD